MTLIMESRSLTQPTKQKFVMTRLGELNYDENIRRIQIFMSHRGYMEEGCARRPDCPLSFGGHRGCGVDGAAKGAAPPPVANLPYHATTSMIECCTVAN